MSRKPMVDGEERIMRPGPGFKYAANRIQVIAHRADSDTPYVILRGVGINGAWEVVLEDVLAEDVAQRIYRALSVLPTSK